MSYRPALWRAAVVCTATLGSALWSLCAQATVGMDAALPALLRPQVHAAVLAVLPPALQAHAQLDIDFFAARGAAQRRCPDRWHIGRLDTQQLHRVNVPLVCLGERGSVVARVQLRGPVPHLAQAAPAQHRLRAQDITTRTAAIAHVERWLSAEQLPGQLLRRASAAGSALDARAVERPVLLHRGDAVQIVANGGGVRVQVPGIATATARLGDVVAVRNARTQQLVRGRLSAPGVVEVGAEHTRQPTEAAAYGVKVLTESSD